MPSAVSPSLRCWRHEPVVPACALLQVDAHQRRGLLWPSHVDASPAKLPLEMRTHRQRSRCLTSLLLVVALLFSQLALASYVCPALSADERMSETMASGMPCDGDDPSMPVLCHQHATRCFAILPDGEGSGAESSYRRADARSPELARLGEAFVRPLRRAARGPATTRSSLSPDPQTALLTSPSITRRWCGSPARQQSPSSSTEIHVSPCYVRGRAGR